MKYEILSIKGHYREINEDLGAVVTNSQGAHLLILCDGMGGYENGEVASKMVIQTFTTQFKRLKLTPNKPKKIENWIKDTIQTATNNMKNAELQHTDLAHMGTTLVLAIVYENHTFICHVGDSRAYWFRKRKIEQITRDQNIRNALLNHGVNMKEAVSHPSGHALFSSLGPNKYAITEFAYVRGWRKNILLTTDGIHDYVSITDMHNILISNLSQLNKGKKIIQIAERNGSRDNMSLIIFERDYYAKRF